MKRLPWSYTSLTEFKTCPLRFYHYRVAKTVKEKESEALIWGNKVHKALEDRIVQNAPLPKSLSRFEPMMARLCSVGGWVAEQSFGLTDAFQPCGFFDRNVWCRGKVDALRVGPNGVACVIDWKTGKVKQDSTQLKLFAAFVLHTYPEVERVKTAFMWLSENTSTRAEYTRQQLHEIWQEFLPTVRRIEQAFDKDVWEPRPNGLCRAWCAVGKRNCSNCGE